VQEFCLTPGTMLAVRATLSEARLGRYLLAAEGDADLALRLYVWNVRLCEAFYLPCQMVEIACRNTIARALAEHYGARWFAHEPFCSTLPNRLRDELDKAALHQRAKHGSRLTGDHIIGTLTFGFWVHLMTRGFAFTLWKRGFRAYFPYMPSGTSQMDLYQRMDRARMFRNRIAHHDAVFDKRPTAEHASLLVLIGWICADTHWLLARLTRVPRTINARPRVVGFG
jgi:hypothetical protein